VKATLVRALSWLEHMLAVVVLAAGLAAAVLAFMGVLTRQTATDAWSVLRGDKRAVAESDYKRWQKMESKQRSRTLVEAEEKVGSGLASEGLQQQRRYWQQQFDKERAVLSTIDAVLADREKAFQGKLTKLRSRQRKFDDEKKAADKKKEDANFKRVVQLYQGMDPELVAEDFQNKWKGTAEQKGEVVDLLRKMPARMSAEIMNSITDTKVRIEIIDRVRQS
jgi:hypothetical protein